MKTTDYTYDVFISHAVEDKEPIANELYKKLDKKGLKVWYSGSDLKVGDRLAESIHDNLDQCRFGVTILSPTYLSKIWTLNEFFFFLKRDMDGNKTILPVLYNITPEELAAKFTPMANIVAIRSDRGIDFVADKLFEEIQKQHSLDKKSVLQPVISAFKRRSVIIAILAVIVSGILYLSVNFANFKPSTDLIEQTIRQRIELLQQKTDHDLHTMIETAHGRIAPAEKIKDLYSTYINTDSYYRNEYILKTGYTIIRARRNVEAALATDITNISPFNLYTFTSPHIYKLDSALEQNHRQERYLYYNTQPVTYQIKKTANELGEHKVSVTYANPMRMVYTTLTFPISNSGTKYQQMDIMALRPAETYTFAHENDAWILKTVE
jgi:hypothetical protein